MDKVVVRNNQNMDQSHVVISEPKIQSETPKESEKAYNGPFFVNLVKKAVNLFFDFLESIVVALSIFVVIYLFIIQPHEVKGSSMVPSFHDKEYILTDKISYKINSPRRGDVIIFKAPVNPDMDYIKRIIGLPGETVTIKKGEVYVNDKKLFEPYLDSNTPLFPQDQVKEGIPVLVPENYFFVMGDNRPHSSDSRFFGPVDKKLIVGRAVFRYWPINEIGAIKMPSYQF